MADKFTNPLDSMRALPESETPRPVTSQRKGQKKSFGNPLQDISARDKGLAVGSSLVAGQYIRRTFTFTPGQLERIRDVARELHIAETGVARWLIDEGLAQWERGIRPELEERAVKLEPKLRNW